MPVVKVDIAEIHASGAKAPTHVAGIFGTAEAVPFQNSTFDADH